MPLSRKDIQKVAIVLFNERGISSVTMKQIADYMRISPGNLTYHYKTKASIMSDIYHSMDAETLDFMSFEGYITLHHFEQMMLKFYDFDLRYRFFFNDVVFITRQFPEVAELYEASNLRRFSKGRKLIDYYVESGRMVQEDNLMDYDKLIYTIWMVSAFWQAQAQVIKDERYTVNKVDPIDMVWPLMFPYLTERGKAEYYEMKKFASNKYVETKISLK